MGEKSKTKKNKNKDKTKENIFKNPVESLNVDGRVCCVFSSLNRVTILLLVPAFKAALCPESSYTLNLTTL